MAFHDPIDAISWALEVQQELLGLPWPDQLLTQPDAALLYSSSPGQKDLVLFKGLRVRMAMHTGLPEAVQVRGPCIHSQEIEQEHCSVLLLL